MKFLIKLFKINIAVTWLICLPFIWMQVSAFGLSNSFLKVESEINSSQLDTEKYGLVLGAGLIDRRPSKVLRLRLEKAIQLYNSGQINKIIVSGANPSEYYNEPKAMESYLINRGISETDIFQDLFGDNTFESCRQAKEVFDLEKVVLISQSFHLGRARFLCQSFGMQVRIAAAANSSWYGTIYGSLREIPASLLALWRVYS